MNEKSLNREELDVLFNKYSYVKNVNEINFLAKINKPDVDAIDLKFSNPHFHIIKASENFAFQTARTIVEIPSPYRVSSNNQAYITKIPIFTTDKYAEYLKELVTPNVDYLSGIGKLQNYRVVMKKKPNDDIAVFLYNLIVKELNLKVENVENVERILNILIDKENSKNMVLTNIWSNNIENGQKLADSKIEKDELPEINDVTLQGLVYMPPSIREIKNKNEYSLHFKLRIKREKIDEEQNVPTMHQFDYDYINVIAFGEDALKGFNTVKQGHPALVHGRIESSKFLKRRKIEQYQKEGIAKELNISLDSPYLEDIVNFFNSQQDVAEYPNFNVWADKIETDESKLIK